MFFIIINIFTSIIFGGGGTTIQFCLGHPFGQQRPCLQQIYCALISSVIDYGYIIYGSASKSWINKVETVQAQALRICCGAFRSSPISAMQVEVGELPISIRKLKLTMNYWINIKGHTEILSLTGQGDRQVDASQKVIYSI